MLQIIEAKKRHFRDIGWLQSHWLFSFSDYYDPENVKHGVLRVFNDDIVQPHSGFGTHPHEEMEIISIVLEGEMSHKDSMGNEMVVKQNDVQRMTAGTGIQHSELNTSDKPVAFFQIWILPDKKGQEPSYDQKTFSEDYWKNNLALLASDKTEGKHVKLNTEASLFRAKLDAGGELSYTAAPEYYQFLYIIDGHMEVNGKEVSGRDQVRLQGEESLLLKAVKTSDFILIDIPAQ